MLGISADELAKATNLGIATIRRAESHAGVPTLTTANLTAIQSALEAAGIDFIFEDGSGAGIRLRRNDGQERTGDAAGNI
ncbi:helix-turn-helix domain-containing protein [Niveispirillum sp. KHB5.9]|uniref:helix-turn-helix domain-containing protein n=1 Tax=Niveispirillum sp. KHB5.9 TaxID=3400269 RepID=UPI003A85D828